MAIDPRIRERRIEVLREAGRRRLRVTLVIASAIVVLGLVYVVLHSPMLDVDHVRVTGAHRESAADIRAAARVRLGAPIVFVDTGAAARRVDRLAWVERARVRRELPGTIQIDVTEYVPTAYVRLAGGRIALVASNDRVIALGGAVPAGAVEIRGERTIPTVGAVLSPRGVAAVVRHLPVRLGQRVVAVDVSKPSIALDLRRGGEVRLGALNALTAKAAAALAVLDHLAGAPFQYIDVSAPSAPSSH